MKGFNSSPVLAGSRALILLLAVLPAIYVFIAIQYSAITVPFWDHTELIRWIAAYYDGTFEISSLWAPHNHTRPLVYRAVMLSNAVLTGWDIRSEYIYMYATIYGVFACHWLALRKLTRTGDSLVFPVSLLLISLLLFSPAGHNNHWWSMMFVLNVANLLIVLGLFCVALNPHRWVNHIAGATSCWLAAYSLTNGLIAFMSVILMLQLSSGRLFRPNKWTLFWVVNFVILLVLYLPGIESSGGSAHPSIIDVTWFALTYLGSPLGSILWFPFKGQFDLPISTVFNGLCGLVLVTSTALLYWHARDRLRKSHPAALILVGFAVFAGASALVTGWGRANFDAQGVSNANASRYTLFGVYLLLGQIYYVAAGYAEGWWRVTPIGSSQWDWQKGGVAFAVALFAILSGVTYVRAVHVYKEAHKTNVMLTNAYPLGVESSELDQFIHPNPDFVRQLKVDLQRLELGPYRAQRLSVVKLPIGEYKRPFSLSGDKRLAQQFRANASGLKRLGVTMVTWGNKQVSYKVAWRLSELTSNERIPVAKGYLNSSDVSDWQTIYLNLPYLSNSMGRSYELEFGAEEKSGDERAVGLALYSMENVEASLQPAIISGEAIPERLTLGLRLEYAK